MISLIQYVTSEVTVKLGTVRKLMTGMIKESAMIQYRKRVW